MSFLDKIGWTPSIGDPSLMGWFTVLAYLVVAIIALKVFKTGEFVRVATKQRRLWLGIAIILFFLCINKQLDLQSLLTASAKYFFNELGIYEFRKLFQLTFIIIIFIVGFVCAYWLFFQYQMVIKNHLLALIGLVFLLGFVLIRASSFHGMDLIINYSLLGFRMNWFLELTGITLIGINGVKLLQRKVVKRKRRSKSRSANQH
jgi:hypothetical protein